MSFGSERERERNIGPRDVCRVLRMDDIDEEEVVEEVVVFDG